MKKSSLVLLALLATAPVFANEVSQPLTLASADTSVSTNLKTVESNEFGVRLDQEVNAANNALNAKIDSELTVNLEKAVASVKF